MSKKVAVIGASRDPKKYSHKAIKAFQMNGYDVFPVNPNAKTIAGCKCYATFADIPEQVDEVTVYLPPDKTLAFLDELAVYELEHLYLNPGSADYEVKKKAEGMGLPIIQACSIVAQGYNPDSL